MKFLLKKSVLKAAFSKATEVGTKGIKADFDQANRICIIAEANKITLSATNGHLDYCEEIVANTENCLKVEQTGQVIAQADAAAPVASAIAGSNSDAIIEVWDEKDSLTFRNTSAKRKEIASIETFQTCKSVDIPKPRKPICTLSMPSSDAERWIKTVLPYVSKRGYKLRYQMLCFHMLKEQTRFVCGDGSRFGILTVPVVASDEAKLVLPEDQMQIVLSVISDSNKVSFSWVNKQTCYIATDNNREMYLRGIPDLDYIAYDVHAFNEADSRYIADFNMNDYAESMALAGAVRDEEYEKTGGFFHTATMEISCTAGKTGVAVVERRKSHQEIDVQVYKTDSSAPDEFKIAFCHGFLWEAAKQSSASTLRIYFLKKNGVAIVCPVDLLDSKKDGIPEVKETSDKSEFRMFFAAVKEKSSDE